MFYQGYFVVEYSNKFKSNNLMRIASNARVLALRNREGYSAYLTKIIKPIGYQLNG